MIKREKFGIHSSKSGILLSVNFVNVRQNSDNKNKKNHIDSNSKSCFSHLVQQVKLIFLLSRVLKICIIIFQQVVQNPI